MIAKDAFFRMRLSRRLALKGRTSLFLLLLSLFLLSLVFIVSLSLLLSLQSEQIGVIRDVLDFDLQVPYFQHGDEKLRNTEGIASVYLCSDILLFGKGYSSPVKKRLCDASLFGDERFLRRFDQFPVLQGDEDFTIVSAFSEYGRGDEAYYVTKGKNGRANIFRDDGTATAICFTPYTQVDDMVFENIFSQFDEQGLTHVDSADRLRHLNPKIKSEDSLYYGVYAYDASKAEKSLKDRGIAFRNFKQISKSVYSALIVERIAFFVILFFLLVVLLVMVCRVFFRFLDQDEKNAAALMVLGMDRGKAIGVFVTPCIMLVFASIALGVAAGVAFISTDGLKRAVFRVLFGSDAGALGFGISFPFAVGFLTLCLVLVLAMRFVMVARLRRTDVIEIVKSEGV